MFFLLAGKLNHKCLVKVRPFSSVKVRCMHDHVIMSEANLIRTMLSFIAGGNSDLSSERTASQIAGSITELALSLKSQDNKISMSHIVPRNDNLNNKASELNSRLIHMCAEQNILYIDHTNSIQLETHLNEGKLHLTDMGQ